MRFFLLFALFCFSFSFSQRQEFVDFEVTMGFIEPDMKTKSIKGKVWVTFYILKKVDSIFLNAESFNFKEVELNQEKANYDYDNKILVIKHNFQEGDFFDLYLEYECKPEQTVYFIGFDDFKNGNEQIWTQGQGKYTSHWLPSIDSMEDKIEFDLSFLVDEGYDVIANGELKGTFTEGDLVKWEFDMNQPMSSYLVAFVIGDFEKKVLKSKSGIPLELYYEPKDSLKFEPTYRYSREIFDFLEQEIGVNYPWQNYKQVPVQDFLYAGMENTSCTIFSNQFVIDSTAFVDKNYVNVNAHELAHQWFGNLVTEVSGEHHWLHEGFATYYAYLAEKELFGEDHFYWKLYDTAKTLHQLSEDGQGEALTDPGAGSLTFYEKGAWALVLLREQVGDNAFKKGIMNYLNTHAFGNVTIDDFLLEIEKTAEKDLTNFKNTWLLSQEFPWTEVEAYLKEKSKPIRIYFSLNSSLDGYDKRFDPLMRMWDGFTSDNLKIKFINRYIDSFNQPYFLEGLKKESVKVRQAFAIAMKRLSSNDKSFFEGLLTDKSYVTQETTLFKLWEAFPDNRSKYLKQLDGVVGLPNKNVRQLWLTLALVTPEFETERKKEFYDELNGLTAPQHNFEVRQLAFQYLSQIQALSDASIKNLVLSLDHHAWQFKKSSRNLIRQLYNTPEGKMRLEQLEKQWPDKLRQNFQKVINP